MDEALFRTGRTDVNNHNEDTSSRAKIINGDGGEHENDSIHLKVEQTEPQWYLKGNQSSSMSFRSTLQQNRCLRHRWPANWSSCSPRKYNPSWRILWTTFCNARMRRWVQELVLSFTTSLNNFSSICCAREWWGRFSKNTSWTILAQSALLTKSLKTYNSQSLTNASTPLVKPWISRWWTIIAATGSCKSQLKIVTEHLSRLITVYSVFLECHSAKKCI